MYIHSVKEAFHNDHGVTATHRAMEIEKDNGFWNRAGNRYLGSVPSMDRPAYATRKPCSSWMGITARPSMRPFPR